MSLLARERPRPPDLLTQKNLSLWNLIRSSVTSGQDAPDGTTTAYKIVENTDANTHYAYQDILTVGQAHVATFYLKAAERALAFAGDNATSSFVIFDLVAGTVAIERGGATGRIIDMHNGWYLCAVLLASAASGFLIVGPAAAATSTGNNYAGDGSSGVLAWQPNARDGSQVMPVPFDPEKLTFLIAGQSNAGGQGDLTDAEESSPDVRMLGNDYLWKEAYEPVDDTLNYVDEVSNVEPASPKHSFGVKFGKELVAATGARVYLIPAALGGSVVHGGGEPGTGLANSWNTIGADLLDRSTLFGSANYRAQLSAVQEGGPVDAIIWYQGESERDTPFWRLTYASVTDEVMDRFDSELGVPIIYVQLAVHNTGADNDNMQEIREAQRLMETGSGDATERANFHMVVAHDLPMTGDGIHVSKAGQITLGTRLALAVREHVLGEVVNGTGPRLVSITQPTSTTVQVKTDSVINESTTYDDYFTVFDDGVEAAISSISRDPGDATAVLITLAGAPAGVVTVEYKPQPRAAGVAATEFVQDSDGLPLPAFGPIGLTA